MGDAIRRLFVAEIPQPPSEVRLTGEEKHYVCSVLRMGPGDTITLFDGKGWDYRAEIVESTQAHIRVQILERRKSCMESPAQILLGLGVLKAQKMEWVIQKTVELGIHGILPVNTSRTVPTGDRGRSEGKRQRWEKIAQEAARQCGRAFVPQIHGPVSLRTFLEQTQPMDLRVLLSPTAPNRLEGLATGTATPPRRIALLIGPEGGLSPEEENISTAKGFKAIGLGPRVLRAETAAIVAVALLQSRFGDLAGCSPGC